MSTLADTTAATLTKALVKLADVGVTREVFCNTYDIPPHLVDGAVDGEEPSSCTYLLVKALKLLALTYEELAEDERNCDDC